MNAVAIAKLMRERLVEIEAWVGEEYGPERDGLRAALRCLGEHVPITQRPGKGRRSHHTLEDVRDYAVAQKDNGRFTVTRMCDDLGIPRSKADGFIVELVDMGIVRKVGQGRTRGYKFVPIDKQVAQRQRMVEKRMAEKNGNGYSNGAAVPGTGKRNRVRTGDGETDSLIRDIERAGAEVVPNGGHLGVYLDGRRVDTLGSSPSDHRSVPNARAQLKRRGVPL